MKLKKKVNNKNPMLNDEIEKKNKKQRKKITLFKHFKKLSLS